jgi:hypothetical protein
MPFPHGTIHGATASHGCTHVPSEPPCATHHQGAWNLRLPVQKRPVTLRVHSSSSMMPVTQASKLNISRAVPLSEWPGQPEYLTCQTVPVSASLSPTRQRCSQRSNRDCPFPE